MGRKKNPRLRGPKPGSDMEILARMSMRISVSGILRELEELVDAVKSDSIESGEMEWVKPLNQMAFDLYNAREKIVRQEKALAILREKREKGGGHA